MYGESRTYTIEYEMLWANKVVESDVVEVIARDDWDAKCKVVKEIQKKNKRAMVNIKAAIVC